MAAVSLYTVLGRAEPALHHARRCLELCEANPEAIEDWDLPYAYEALARAHALAGEADEARAATAAGDGGAPSRQLPGAGRSRRRAPRTASTSRKT